MVFMKLKWEDVYDIFDGASLWENGHDMYWYKLMWGLVDYKHLNEYDDEAERMKVLSKAFAIIKIYMNFIENCFGTEDEEFSEAISAYSSEVFDFLFEESDVKEIFTALSQEMGIRRTFYTMFITCIEFKTYNSGKILNENDCGADEEDIDFINEYLDDETDDDEIRYLCYHDDICEELEDDGEYEDEHEYIEDSSDDSDDEEETDEEISDQIMEDPFDESGFKDYSEDYYDSFDEYLKVIALSSMSLLVDVTPEKAAGYLYLASNMKNNEFIN